MRIHYLQHVEFEDLGFLKKWAKTKGYTIKSTKLYLEQQLPDIAEFDFLIILGGPMSVNDSDKLEWLKKEKELIKNAIISNKKILGICLGAQLLAEALGAKIYKNKNPEIGWFKIFESNREIVNSKDLPTECLAFHWHGETFQVPDGATILYSSDACENQIFSYKNNILAIQCHLEIDKIGVQKLLINCSSDLNQLNKNYIQKEEEILKIHNFYDINNLLNNIIEKYLEI